MKLELFKRNFGDIGNLIKLTSRFIQGFEQNRRVLTSSSDSKGVRDRFCTSTLYIFAFTEIQAKAYLC